MIHLKRSFDEVVHLSRTKLEKSMTMILSEGQYGLAEAHDHLNVC